MESYFKRYLPEQDLFDRHLVKSEKYIDLYSALAIALQTKKYNNNVESTCDALFKQASLYKKFFQKYTHDWRPICKNEPADSQTSALAVLLLYIWFKKNNNPYRRDLGKQLNALNTILTCIKHSKEIWLRADSLLYKDILRDLDELTSASSTPPKINSKNYFSDYEKLSSIEPKTIPITIMYSEGPIGRAYLKTFELLRLRPEKIIHLVFSRDRSSGESIGRFLPKKIRSLYCYEIEDFRMNYWPRNIKKNHPHLFSAISSTIAGQLDFPIDFIENTTGKVDFESCANTVESLLIENLHDDSLTSYLSQRCEGNILFTGGGIVPKKNFDLQNIQLLHVHPGFLPDIRGADCSLWSSLVFGLPSASAFFMDPRIDMGEVVLSTWLPSLEVRLTENYSSDILYRSVFSFIDPWIRSFALRLLLLTIKNEQKLNFTKQEESSGTTFYFMSEKFREIALKKYFAKI